MTADEGPPSALPAASLLDRLADLVIALDGDGRIAFASRSVTAVSGYEAGDLVGRAALELVDPADRVRVLLRYARMRNGKAARPSSPLRFRVRRKDGRWLAVESNPAALPDTGRASASGWVDVLRDAEAATGREHGLEAARRSAEDDAKAQAEFLANMSHEIRTPLNSIIGFMQVLKRDGGLGDIQLGHVGRVEDAGRNLLRVVNDVLDLSKTESGTLRLDERRFSPEALVRDATALIRPQATEKALRLEVEIEPDAATPVIGDLDRLRQILLNLLSNAVKFTAQGEVRLRLGTVRAGPMLHLDIVIEDSGMGIAPEQLPKLFRRFTQADGTIARRFGGTGLGLAISKRLIEAMDGSIAVESTLNVGSRFVVRVPLKVADPDTGRAVHSGVTRLLAPARADTLRDRRLLVAEDVVINQKLVEAILGPLGCTVDMVADGAEALHAVQQQDYAVVLMDMQMPGLDGPAASRAIRALGGHFVDLPIVALTANVFPEEMERARAAGMNDVVTKPIDSERLIATVLKWAEWQA